VYMQQQLMQQMPLWMQQQHLIMMSGGIGAVMMTPMGPVCAAGPMAGYPAAMMPAQGPMYCFMQPMYGPHPAMMQGYGPGPGMGSVPNGMGGQGHMGNGGGPMVGNMAAGGAAGSMGAAPVAGAGQGQHGRQPPAPPRGPVPPPPPPPRPPAGGSPAARTAGNEGAAAWSMRMSPQQLRKWQQWQQQCFAGSPSCAVMSGVCGFVRWSSVAVQHCHGAQGLVLEHSQGWKLVYSGA
jgi:hypothetical protein